MTATLEAEIDQRECDERDDEDAAQHLGRDVRPAAGPLQHGERDDADDRQREGGQAPIRARAAERPLVERGGASRVRVGRTCHVVLYSADPAHSAVVCGGPASLKRRVSLRRNPLNGERVAGPAGRRGNGSRGPAIPARSPDRNAFVLERSRSTAAFPAAMTNSPAVAQRKRCGRVWRRYFPTM